MSTEYHEDGEAVLGSPGLACSASPYHPPGPHELLRSFVDCYSGMRQRGADWYASMGTTVGGSEIAAIMGKNPYTTFFDVVLSKVITLEGGNAWTGGGVACWWGTLFEDVIAKYVEIDLGSEVLGDEICIQEFPGHRNSPDGYIVVLVYRAANGSLQIWTTDMDPDLPTDYRICLLEFKCPISRRPKGDVPSHYRPQVLSGLAVSPVANLGIFVDAVFRKCSLFDLGDNPEYDTAYHRKDNGAWVAPVAWGIIGVYAPLLDAPLGVRLGWRGEAWAEGDPSPDVPDADAAQAAYQIHSGYFGATLRDQKKTYEVADLGDMDWRLFDRTMGLIDRKRFPVRRTTPCFADGRGGTIVGVVDALRAGAPAGHWLMGVLPWKLFEVNYVPVARAPGFMNQVLPLINDVHRAVAEARATPDPLAFITAKARPTPPVGRSATISESNIDDLFSSI